MSESKIISIQSKADKPDQEAINAMKTIMASVRKAEESAPGSKVDDLVNNLVDFMLTLTQADCVEFASSIRKVMDGVVDARSTCKDEYLTTFGNKPSSELTDHQRLVIKMRETRSIIEGTNLQNEISRTLEQAGFNPKVPCINNLPEVDNDVDLKSLENRINHLETTLISQLTEIHSLISQKR